MRSVKRRSGLHTRSIQVSTYRSRADFRTRFAPCIQVSSRFSHLLAPLHPGLEQIFALACSFASRSRLSTTLRALSLPRLHPRSRPHLRTRPGLDSPTTTLRPRRSLAAIQVSRTAERTCLRFCCGRTCAQCAENRRE